MFGCKQEGYLWDFSPYRHLRLKGCLFFFQYVQLSKDTLEEVSQLLPTQLPSDVNKSRAHRSLSKFWLFMWGFFFFPLSFFFKRTTAKNDCSQLKLHNLFFLCPESATDIMWKIRPGLLCTRQVKPDSSMKYRIFEFLKGSLSNIFDLGSYWFQYKKLDKWSRQALRKHDCCFDPRFL